MVELAALNDDVIDSWPIRDAVLVRETVFAICEEGKRVAVLVATKVEFFFFPRAISSFDVKNSSLSNEKVKLQFPTDCLPLPVSAKDVTTVKSESNLPFVLKKPLHNRGLFFITLLLQQRSIPLVTSTLVFVVHWILRLYNILLFGLITVSLV
jgi:hypothetical protein